MTYPYYISAALASLRPPERLTVSEWADKYKGQFDDGWDAYREKVFARQKELGIIPKDAELSRHDPDVQNWETLSADEKKEFIRMLGIIKSNLNSSKTF